MCDFGISASTISIISLATAAASAAAGTYAAVQQAAFASAAAKRQAKAADITAGAVRDQGQQEAFNTSQKSSQDASEATSEAASSGVDVQGSSTGDVVDRMAGASFLGQRNAQVSAMRQAWGYEYQADQYMASAQQAQITGALGATSSILGGLGSAAGEMGTMAYRKKKLTDAKLDPFG